MLPGDAEAAEPAGGGREVKEERRRVLVEEKQRLDRAQFTYNILLRQSHVNGRRSIAYAWYRLFTDGQVAAGPSLMSCQ